MIEREMIPPLIAFAGCLVILFGVVTAQVVIYFGWLPGWVLR